MNRSLVAGALAGAAALALSACSASGEFSIGGKSIKGAGEDLISGEFSDQLALGELDPTCEDVADGEVGTTFTCTALTPDGETVNFVGVVDAEDHINLNTTNAVDAEKVEAAFVAALTEARPDIPLEAENVDCGEGFSILTNSETTCDVTPPGGSTQTARLTFTDTTTGEFDYVFEEAG